MRCVVSANSAALPTISALKTSRPYCLALTALAVETRRQIANDYFKMYSKVSDWFEIKIMLLGLSPAVVPCQLSECLHPCGWWSPHVTNVLSSEVGLSPAVSCLSVSLPLWLVVPSDVTNVLSSEVGLSPAVSCLSASTLVAGGPLMSPMFCPQRLDCHQLSVV